MSKNPNETVAGPPPAHQEGERELLAPTRARENKSHALANQSLVSEVKSLPQENITPGNHDASKDPKGTITITDPLASSTLHTQGGEREPLVPTRASENESHALANQSLVSGDKSPAQKDITPGNHDASKDPKGTITITDPLASSTLHTQGGEREPLVPTRAPEAKSHAPEAKSHAPEDNPEATE